MTVKKTGATAHIKISRPMHGTLRVLAALEDRSLRDLVEEAIEARFGQVLQNLDHMKQDPRGRQTTLPLTGLPNRPR